jgi:gas vesicle protein
MRKYSLVLGALGGAFAGYIFSNEKLRKELTSVKTPEDAGKILAKHLQKDGKRLGTQVKKLVDSEVVKDNVKKLKEYAQDSFDKAKDELGDLVKKGQAEAKKLEKKAVKTVKKLTK